MGLAVKCAGFAEKYPTSPKKTKKQTGTGMGSPGTVRKKPSKKGKAGGLGDTILQMVAVEKKLKCMAAEVPTQQKIHC